MKTKNSCYTYFRMCGNFDPNYVSELLNLQPVKSWGIGDTRADGTEYDFANWEFGRCDDYDVDVSNQMRNTISLLKEKIDLLNKIREENDVEFFLEIVPHIYADDTNPCLAPSLDIIDFCHATRTKIDIDMYVYNSND